MTDRITRPVSALVLAALLAMPLAAQEEDGFNLMEEGAKLFLRGLMSEMEPTFEELESLADEFGPAMRGMAENLRPIVTDILEAVDDIQYYRDIEILENGDILIRRSPLAPPFGQGEDLPGSGAIDAPEIEL